MWNNMALHDGCRSMNRSGTECLGCGMKSLNRALDILELIADHRGIGIREIAQRSGLPPATVHRIVAALSKRGYLNKDNRSHRYALSPKFMALGERVQQQIDIVSVAKPFLEELMAATRENANLCIRNGSKIVYVDQVASPDHNLQIFTKLGASAPLYASGVGKVFLAHVSDAEFDDYVKTVDLHPFTAHTKTTAAALQKEVAAIRQAGYGVDDEERELGVRCVAAPVFDHTDRIVAAISVSGAVQRIPRQRLTALGKQVLTCARHISTAMGNIDPR